MPTIVRAFIGDTNLAAIFGVDWNDAIVYHQYRAVGVLVQTCRAALIDIITIHVSTRIF